MTVAGIDVSNNNPATWSTTGVDFVIIKATEGHTFTDPDQSAHAARARKAGAVVGFYHFLWPGNIAEQAAYFVQQCASVEGDILAVDWETTSAGTFASCAEKDAFITEVRRLRPTHKVILYTDVDFWLNKDSTSQAGHGLWIARYGVVAGKPGIKAPFLFHQYTDKPLDMSVGEFASRAALAEWAGAPKAPAQPHVSLANVVAAAHRDPGLAQGGTTHAGDVKPVEQALQAEGLLAGQYAADGSFGSRTVTAYKAWQERLGYTGADADGIPGVASLKALGAKHGFTVTS